MFQEYLEINPCANKDSCSECLRDESCNWCSDSKYSHPDGSPLPRCNGDDFFASTLCPSEAKADPERALTNFEDCSTCNHTCSGGICNEDKKVKKFILIKIEAFSHRINPFCLISNA